MNLTEEAQAALASVRTNPPPNGFGQPPLFTRHLQVNYLPFEDQKYWLYDHEGFLCATSDLRVVDLLLKLEAEPPADPSRPLLHGGAREALFPGASAEREAAILHMQENARRLAANYRGRHLPGGSLNMTGDPSGFSSVSSEQALDILGL